jgi:hypothetical protein
MNDPAPKHVRGQSREVWLLTSELEGERASSHRQFRWCTFLIDSGLAIEAFTLKGAIRVSHRTLRTHADLDRLREDIRRGAKPAASVREGIAARAVRRVKHMLLVDLWLPNVLALFVRLLLRSPAAGKRVVIVASSPPFSVVVIGALLRSIRPDRFLFAVDMRDAWAHHRALGGLRPLRTLIERSALSRADACVTVSNQLADEFRAYGRPVQVAYNVATHVAPSDRDSSGFDWTSLHPSLHPASAKLVYTGSMPEGHFDLETIVGGIRHAVAAGSLRRERNQVVFVGACDSLRRLVDGSELEGAVVFVPHQTSRVARMIQANADALLFLGYNDEGNGGVVSTKLFEYLSLGRPILPIMVRAGSDVDTLLGRYGGRRINAIGPLAVGELLGSWASGAGSLPRCRDSSAMDDLLQPYRDFCDGIAAGTAAKVDRA